MKASRVTQYLIAGFCATWFMDRVDKVVYLLQSDDVHKREAALEDLTGPGKLARILMRTAGHEPTHDESVALGRGIHIAFGMTSAVAYGVASDAVPPLRAGCGLLFGLLLTPANVLVVPAVGLTPPAWKFPAETTVRSVIYHLAYGFALESIARLWRLHEAPTT